MKIFVSWSGNLSCEIAELLKKWIPCILQSVEVFFSSIDIEKGDNWDKTISTELSECKYGIICLTKDNIAAPWINFEAGAIAKSLDSRVSALMVNIKPSDIKGPISRYQATKFEKDDFFQLISSINKVLENPLEASVLQNTFNAMWLLLEQEALPIIEKYSKPEKTRKNDNDILDTAPLEEILQILRQQSAILSNPDKLLPIDYLEYIQRKLNDRSRALSADTERLLEELLHYLDNVLTKFETVPSHAIFFEFTKLFDLSDLIEIVSHTARNIGNKRMYSQARRFERLYYSIVEGKDESSLSQNTD